MKILNKYILTVFVTMVALATVFAGNPDRQGEAGAAELLLNPWARSAGLHGLNTSTITGIESMRLNIAGLSRIQGKEFILANTRLYSGSDTNINAFGFGNRFGENGAFGITIMAMDFGDIPVTTTDSPEGTGGVFSPSFINIGLGYSYMYENKISVGMLVRAISESTSDVSAMGFAIDAGVQYVTGDEDNFRLGISLRNVGSSMSFNGQGLSTKFTTDAGFTVTGAQRSEQFELPSVLNIGLSYDFYFGRAMDEEGNALDQNVVVRAIGNFTSNAFSRDQLGVGVEAMFADMFTVRAAYKKAVGDKGVNQENLYTGLAGGASVELPFTKGGTKKIGLDYAYRATDPFKGTHNISVRLIF